MEVSWPCRQQKQNIKPSSEIYVYMCEIRRMVFDLNLNKYKNVCAFRLRKKKIHQLFATIEDSEKDNTFWRFLFTSRTFLVWLNHFECFSCSSIWFMNILCVFVGWENWLKIVVFAALNFPLIWHHQNQPHTLSLGVILSFIIEHQYEVNQSNEWREGWSQKWKIYALKWWA